MNSFQAGGKGWQGLLSEAAARAASFPASTCTGCDSVHNGILEDKADGDKRVPRGTCPQSPSDLRTTAETRSFPGPLPTEHSEKSDRIFVDIGSRGLLRNAVMGVFTHRGESDVPRLALFLLPEPPGTAKPLQPAYSGAPCSVTGKQCCLPEPPIPRRTKRFAALPSSKFRGPRIPGAACAFGEASRAHSASTNWRI
jgi:hypothetical protein